jgi:MFS superfamily sulfate permease-like transporter
MNARASHPGDRGRGGRVISILTRVIPFLGSFESYSFAKLRADFVSGLTVALVLIPQSMAYAQLADLPAFYGLYAAFLPPLVAALFGSSRQLATGPVAVVSLMTATALAPLATGGSEAFIAYAILLSLMVGVFQFTLGVLRLGMIVNFLSHPVVNGFTNAAAIIIATSQLGKLFGVEVDKAEHHYETVYRTVVAAVHHTHWPTLGLGILAFLIMFVLRKISAKAPNVLIAVLVTTVIAWATGFERNETVSLARIEVERVHELVAEYDTTLNATYTTMDGKLAVSDELRAAVQAHGTHSLEAIDLHAEERRLEIRTERLKEKAEILRAELREFRFAGVRGPDGACRFFLPGTEPSRGESLGSQWRISVGNGTLEPSALTLMGGGAVVGTIPQGLPRPSAPHASPHFSFSVLASLISMSIIISVLGFMEAISIAKAMAARTGQRLDPNQELIGQGLANIAGSFTQSYPVSGSFSRSAVNFQAGAVTGLSSVFSSLVVVATLLFFTPLLYYLPQSVLAAIIMMAVIGLLNVSGFVHAWQAQRYDGLISVMTFAATLVFAPHLDRGIILGVILSVGVYLYRNMRPRIVTLSKTTDGDYRDARRWNLDTCRHVAVVRCNSSLFFANVDYMEDVVQEVVLSMPELRAVMIVGNGVNELDASGEVFLSRLVTRLREKEIDIYFTGLNDHVLDVMRRTHLYEKIGEDHFFRSLAHAVGEIHEGVCLATGEHDCPLIYPRFEGLEVEPSIRRSLQKAHDWAEKDK